MLRINIEPAEAVRLSGDAIPVIVTLTNSGDTAAELALVGEPTTLFQLRLDGHGWTNRQRILGEPAFTLQDRYTVNPGGSKTERLFVNEFVGWPEPGVHKVEVSLKESSDVIAMCRIEILADRNPAKTRQELERAWTRYLDPRTEPREAAFHEKLITLTRNPIAVDIQLQMLSRPERMPREDFAMLVRSLIYGGSPKAFDAMARQLSRAESPSLRAIILWELHLRGFESLPQEIRQVLSKYENDIGKATPIGYSD